MTMQERLLAALDACHARLEQVDIGWERFDEIGCLIAEARGEYDPDQGGHMSEKLFKSVLEVTIIHTEAEAVNASALITGGKSKATACRRLLHRELKDAEKASAIAEVEEMAQQD